MIWERRRPRAFTTIGASTLPTTQRCRLRQPRLRPAAIRQSAQTTTTGIKKFDIFRKKRNISDYERADTISASDVEEMRSLAEKLRVDFEAWRQKNHPQLKA